MRFSPGGARGRHGPVRSGAGVFRLGLGPALGGLLTEHFNWRWVFYVNLPVGLVDALLIVLLVREIHLAGDSRRFDVLGFGLVGTALSALIVLLGKGQELGWLNSDGIVILLVITLVTAAAGERFVWGWPGILYSRDACSANDCSGWVCWPCASCRSTPMVFPVAAGVPPASAGPDHAPSRTDSSSRISAYRLVHPGVRIGL